MHKKSDLPSGFVNLLTKMPNDACYAYGLKTIKFYSKVPLKVCQNLSQYNIDSQQRWSDKGSRILHAISYEITINVKIKYS